MLNFFIGIIIGIYIGMWGVILYLKIGRTK
jgi:hypothetical protein